MNKKIQDYLHLYLGADGIASGDLPAKLVGITQGYGHDTFYPIVKREGMRQYTDTPNGFKPLLRPLSSMTEEEMDQVVELGGLYRRGDTVEQFTATWKAFGADVFVWLLSHHFDLFGLIDAGLAIDKTSIK